jgi:hypothetical protein
MTMRLNGRSLALFGSPNYRPKILRTPFHPLSTRPTLPIAMNCPSSIVMHNLKYSMTEIAQNRRGLSVRGFC